MRMCMSAAGVPMVLGSLFVPPHREGDQGLPPATRSGSRHPRQYEDRKRARTRRHRLGLCRRSPQLPALDALAQRHGFIKESAVVGGVLGPLATGSAQGFRDLDKRRDIKMTIEITGCAASHDENANVGVARESLQRFGKRVAYLRVE